MLPRYQAPPPVVNDYYLGDMFSVVYPSGTTNLVTNPSSETATTGYTAGAGTLTRVSTWQTHGAYGLQYTPSAAVNDGFYYGTVSLTSGQPYTLSIDFQGVGGRPYQIYFATTGAVLVGLAYTFYATGRKQRIYVTYVETATTTRRLYFAKNNHANVSPFYVDGVQVENKAYPTTYCDGDQVGVVVGRQDFYWTGTPHASTSVRDPQCRVGGRVYKLAELGFNLLAIVGLGLSGLSPLFNPVALGGAAYQGTDIDDRSFTLVGEVSGNTLAEVQRKRQGLIDLFKPDLSTPDQPVAMRYTPLDDCGEQVGDEMDIYCVPEQSPGFSGNVDNRHAERLALSFRVYLPFVGRNASGEVGTVLDFQDSVTNANSIVQRSASGLWSALQTGLNGLVDTIIQLDDGTFAIGGNFTNAGGVADADYLAKYDPATDTFSAFNATPLSSSVAVLLKFPNGNVLVGGNFTNAGGDANADFLCLLTVSTGAYSSINATPLTGGVLDAVFLTTGDIAIGGPFTNAGGVADADFLAKVNGTTFAFSAFNATPLNSTVNTMVLNGSGDLILGGSFTNAGGVAAADYVCKMSATTFAFSALTTTTLNNAVLTLARHQNGDIFIGGQFTTPEPRILRYNGQSFFPLLTGTDNDVQRIFVLRDGSLFIGGLFTTAGTLTVTGYVGWNGSSYFFEDIQLPGPATHVYAFLETVDGKVFVGHDITGTATAAGVTTVTNNGTAKTYPRVRLTGPGTVYQIKNYTTGRVLYFNLTLFASETAILDFSNPQNIRFYSNFRSNLLNTILRGSDYDFFLLPGGNSISLFIAGTTDGNTAATMSWREIHHSIDGAIPARLVP